MIRVAPVKNDHVDYELCTCGAACQDQAPRHAIEMITESSAANVTGTAPENKRR